MWLCLLHLRCEKLVKAALITVLQYPFHLLFDRVTWAVRKRYDSSSSWRKGVVGSHWWHCRARHPGGPAAGPAAAVSPQAEGQAEQHTNGFLLHQPHRQLWIRCSRCSTFVIQCTKSVSVSHTTCMVLSLQRWKLEMFLLSREAYYARFSLTQPELDHGKDDMTWKMSLCDWNENINVLQCFYSCSFAYCGSGCCCVFAIYVLQRCT